MNLEEYKKFKIRIDNIESMFTFLTEEHRLEAERIIKDFYYQDVMKKIGVEDPKTLNLKNSDKKTKN